MELDTSYEGLWFKVQGKALLDVKLRLEWPQGAMVSKPKIECPLNLRSIIALREALEIFASLWHPTWAEAFRKSQNEFVKVVAW